MEIDTPLRIRLVRMDIDPPPRRIRIVRMDIDTLMEMPRLIRCPVEEPHIVIEPLDL